MVRDSISKNLYSPRISTDPNDIRLSQTYRRPRQARAPAENGMKQSLFQSLRNRSGLKACGSGQCFAKKRSTIAEDDDR